MSSKIAIRILLSCVLYSQALALQAQWQGATYIDLGSHNASAGMLARLAVMAGYEKDKFRASSGIQLDLQGPLDKTFTGFFVQGGYQANIKQQPVWLDGFFRFNPFSDLVHETNWGAVASTQGVHMRYLLGMHFRTYKLSRQGADNQPKPAKVHENANLLYLLGYYLKPQDNNWNVGINVTNIDYYLLNQSTNPLFYLQGEYQPTERLRLFAEAWYKSAGAFNISVNYFGFLFRTGLIWKLP